MIGRLACRGLPRFTPMCLGTMEISTVPAESDEAVHPHVPGDNAALRVGEALAQRFTPMRRGQSPVAWSRAANPAVHPHARW